MQFKTPNYVYLSLTALVDKTERVTVSCLKLPYPLALYNLTVTFVVSVALCMDQ